MDRTSPKACACCHVRKIRCDATQVGFPCTKCRADGFECIAHVRKKRQKKQHTSIVENGTYPNGTQFLASIPEHMMSHKFPYYAFFRGFSPRGQPWLHAKDSHHGILLPVPMHDLSASCNMGSGNEMTEEMKLLKAKGALDLPPKEVLNEFVSHYFRLFHPFFPIIDKQLFLNHLRDTDYEKVQAGRGPSLLLIQAIVFTASSTVPIGSIFTMGFSTRRQARSSLHSRVRYLYNFNYEPDDIPNIQALLLMSHYFPSMVDQKHTWIWVHQAISLAQGAGLHRDPGETIQRKFWARIWWACLIRDRLIALGTGRPMHINSLDCNLPMISIADLQEEGDEEDDIAVKAIFVEFTKLCQYMEGILTLPLVNKETFAEQLDLCRKTLDYWSSHLNLVAMRCPGGNASSANSEIPALYRGVLHLVYNTLKISVQQSGRILHRGQESDTRVPSPEVQGMAEDSSQLAANLLEFEPSGAYPTICVTSILPPLAIHLQNLRLYLQSESSYTKTNFRTCMEFLHKLGDVYWHASFYHDIFKFAASTSPLKMASGAANRESIQPPSLDAKYYTGETASNQKQNPGNLWQSVVMNGADSSTTPMDQFSTMIDLQTNSLSNEGVLNNSEHGTENYDLLLSEENVFDGDFLDFWLDDYGSLQNMFPSA